MKRRIPIACLLALCLLVCLACDNVKPTLQGTPTPSASPSPLPEPFTMEITAAPIPTDMLGNEIRSDAHYRQYLSFGELRVYEYDDGTFLDGVCINAFPLAMDGRLDIVYYDADSGKVCGVGTIHNNLGTTRLETGSNAIYAEIKTDIDVQFMDFSLEYKTEYRPVEETADNGSVSP